MTAAEPLRILLIEDTHTDAILIMGSVKKNAPGTYDIQHVSTLAEGLRLLSATKFDVILLDLSLPDTEGFTGLINVQSASPNTPVIILTAHKDEDLAIIGVGHGAQDYLFKDSSNGDNIKRAIQYAMQRKKIEGTLLIKANFDQLTGLANRAFFQNRLDMAIAKSTRSPMGIGIFFLDIDRFKPVNDTMGHAAGDHLLQQIAGRLKTSLRPYDTAARFGGDEFALLVEDIKNNDDCIAIAEKIIQQIGMPFTISNQEVTIGVSIGIATNQEDNALARDLLIMHADTAMYMAKKMPGSCYQFYNQAMPEKKRPHI